MTTDNREGSPKTPQEETPQSQSPSTSPSASSGSTFYDDSSEINELDSRSRQLTELLRNNLRKSDKRTKVIDVVKKRAWLLSDQIEKLEKQTKKTKESLAAQSLKRRLIVFGTFAGSIVLIILGVNHVATSDKD